MSISTWAGSFLSAGSSAVQGDLIGLTVLGGAQATDNPAALPNLSGMAVALKFKDMVRRIPVTAGGDVADPVTVPTSLQITVQDAGFSAADTPVTRTRVINGTLPVKQPFPRVWSDLPSTVPPRTYVAASDGTNGTLNNRAYYTVAGGTKGGTRPGAFDVASTASAVTDGTVSWQRVAVTEFTGFIESQDGADVIVVVALDDYIYATSTIVSVTIGAGVYQASGVVSRARTLTGVAVVNASTLPVPPVAVTALTLPHQVFTGSAAAAIQTEWTAQHGPSARRRLGQQIAGMRTRIVAGDGTALTSWVATNTSVLSNEFSASSPSALPVECYRTTSDATGLATGLTSGNLYIEAEFFPWLGPVLRTREIGDGADWQANERVELGYIRRNGATNYYWVTTAGTTASSVGPTGTGTGIADGTAVWSYWGNEAVQIQTQNVPARWHFRNDVDSLFKRGHAYVNTTGANIGSPVVHATEAAARAAFPTNSYGSIGLAAAALRTYHNTAGGGLTVHDDTAGGSIWLEAGNHSGFGVTSTSIPSGFAWISIAKGPVEGAAEIRTGANKVAPRMVRFAAPSLTVRGFDATAPTQATNQVIAGGYETATTPAMHISAIAFDGITIQQDTGPTGTDISTGFGASHARNVTFLGQATLGNANSRGANALLAGCFTDLTANTTGSAITLISANIFGCSIKPPATATGQSYLTYGRGSVSGRLQPMWIQVGNSFLQQSQNGVSQQTMSVGSGTDTGNMRPTQGVALINLTGEQTSSRFAGIFGDGAIFASPAVYESGVSIVGERINAAYNDPTALLVTNYYAIDGIYHFNNIVYDSTSHSPGSVLRSGPRCQNYAVVYRVGFDNNLNLAGTQNGILGNPDSYAGLRWHGLWQQFTSATVAAQVVDWRAANGNVSPTLGGGDYRPALGATARTMRVGTSLRFDQRGVTRPSTGAVGAIEA